MAYIRKISIISRCLRLFVVSLIVIWADIDAHATTFNVSAVSGNNVLVSRTFRGGINDRPDISTIDWGHARGANILRHGGRGWGELAGSPWISNRRERNAPSGSFQVFHVELTLPQNSYDLSGNLKFLVDDLMWLYVNNTLVSRKPQRGYYSPRRGYYKPRTLDFSSMLESGITSVVMDIVVWNRSRPKWRRGGNPTGLAFAANVSGQYREPGGDTPEPGTMLLLGTALGSLLWIRRRRDFAPKT